MRILKLQQGTEAWAAHRATARNASEAPAVMGCSPYTTRSALLEQKATGVAPEVDAATQRRFDEGHRVEESARPLAEAIIGESLYPVTAVDDDSYLSASFDGVTMTEAVIWECKQWNAEKAAHVEEKGEPPRADWYQVQQQLAVSGAERCLYMVTDGTEEKCAHCWVAPAQADIDELTAAWRQFDRDLETFEPAREAEVIAAPARPETLPALRIEVEGRVIATNLDAYRDHALAVISAVNEDLQTDQDFADAEATAKWCGDVEDRLKAAKEHALSQTADIDALFRTVDDIAETARQKRLALGKLVKARKDAIRSEIAQGGRDGFTDTVSSLNESLRPHGVSLPDIPVDFGAAMKGKRTIASLRSAVDDELARARMAAHEAHAKIIGNLERIRDRWEQFPDLFPPRERQALILKEPDDLVAVVENRIAEHEKAEQERRARAEAQAANQREAAQKPAGGDESMPHASTQRDAPVAPTAPQSEPSVRPYPGDDRVIAGMCRQFDVDPETAIAWMGRVVDGYRQAA